MKTTYQVIIKSTEVYYVEVKADTEDEAIELAHDKLDSKGGRDEHWQDSEGDIEIDIVY